jgi:hypothetical protein
LIGPIKTKTRITCETIASIGEKTNHQFDKIPRVGDTRKLIKGGEVLVDFFEDIWVDNYRSWAV